MHDEKFEQINSVVLESKIKEMLEVMFTAEKAWHEDDMICMILSDKKEIRFPVSLNEKLRNATQSQVSNIEIICAGTGLNWPELDEDLSVTGILEGKYGKV